VRFFAQPVEPGHTVTYSVAIDLGTPCAGLGRLTVEGVRFRRWEVGSTARCCCLVGASDIVFVVSTDGQSLARWKAGLLNGDLGKMAIGSTGCSISPTNRPSATSLATGLPSAPGGLGVDAHGRIHVAANATQQIVRHVP
jgi:hypothetical protein